VTSWPASPARTYAANSLRERLEDKRGEVNRMHPREPATPLADRSTHRIDDHRVPRHEEHLP
jgi:hypothetical protein